MLEDFISSLSNKEKKRLKEFVEYKELTKEEIFENHKNIVTVAIIQHFGNTAKASRIAKKLGAELEDIYQIGYMALWKAINTMKGVNVYGYGMMAIKGDIIEFLQRKGSILKLPFGKQSQLQNELIIDSMDQVNTDSDLGEYSMHDYIPCNVNVENYVIRKIEFENKLAKLKPRDRQVILMKLNGLTDLEISEMLKVTRAAIGSRRERAMKKLVGA